MHYLMGESYIYKQGVYTDDYDEYIIDYAGDVEALMQALIKDGIIKEVDPNHEPQYEVCETGELLNNSIEVLDLLSWNGVLEFRDFIEVSSYGSDGNFWTKNGFH